MLKLLQLLPVKKEWQELKKLEQIDVINYNKDTEDGKKFKKLLIKKALIL